MRKQAVSESNHSAKHILIIIGLTAVYRALFIGSFNVSTDEAYYWMWSVRLDWGYVDHPPMVAYVLWLVGALTDDAPWAWRASAIAISCASSWLVFCTGRKLFSARAGFWAALPLTLSPLYCMALGFILLPESLLIFWTALALYLAAKMITEQRPALFYPLGAVFGLGLSSNPPALLIPTGLVMFCLLSKPHRHWFQRKEPYLGVLLGLLIFSPVIYWNWRHDWAGFLFLSERTEVGDANAAPGLGLAWQSVFFQAIYHTPVVFILLWTGVVLGFRRLRRAADARILLLLCFSLPLLVIFLAAASLRTTQAHWPTSGYLALYVLFPAVVFHERFRWSRAKKALAAVSLGVAAFASGLLPLVMAYPLMAIINEHLQAVVSLPPDAVDAMAQSEGWGQEIRRGLMDSRERIAARQGEPPVILTHFNVLAGLLSYYMYDVCEVISIHAQSRQFDVWYDDQDLQGKPVLFVSAELFDRATAGGDRPEDYYEFEECEAQPDIDVIRRGRRINRVRTWFCTGYKGAVEDSAL